MTIKQIDKRAIELMKENDMDTNDEILVCNVSIIYVTAQRDLLKYQVEETKI